RRDAEEQFLSPERAVSFIRRGERSMPNDSTNFEARSGDTGAARSDATAAPGTQADVQASPTARGGEVIGRVAAPPQLESTPEHFHFWVERDRLIETNQFVRTESTVEGQAVQFFGVIDE